MIAHGVLIAVRKTLDTLESIRRIATLPVCNDNPQCFFQLSRCGLLDKISLRRHTIGFDNVLSFGRGGKKQIRDTFILQLCVGVDFSFQFKAIEPWHVYVGQNEKGYHSCLIQKIQRLFRIEEKNDFIPRINFLENSLQHFLVVNVIFNNDNGAIFIHKTGLVERQVVEEV